MDKILGNLCHNENLGVGNKTTFSKRLEQSTQKFKNNNIQYC